eukprot:CAMPEP_0114510386 /NCGR_PEP_ID=MMETSP0109-20121206/13757_1 /TAXON_ID=29199 /ORGANISM="Chlorarachnion reptans, Strain CCCM449" /LENGTH=330 /DNA_ID=CAMNT_0001689685 /DNA_START=176 /DNA_END=1168 /DNA_ORIENTATION=+
MRYARTSGEGDPYCVPLLVVIQETLKLFSSFLLLMNEVGASRFLSTVHNEIIAKPGETLKLAVPAILFFIQNNCIQMSNTYLPAAVFQVTYQGKTFVVAILSVLMLGTRLQRYKWLAIVGLAAGVSLVNVSNSTDQESRSSGTAEMMLGLAYVVTAALCSGFANVYFEKMVKTASTTESGEPAKKPSLWVRNIQLASFTIVLGLPAIFYSSSFDMLNPWRGFNFSVWAVAINNAWGGLLVAMILKYGNNILKGFSNAISTVLATLVSIPLFGFETGSSFAVGVVLVIWSTLMYGNMIKFESKWWNTVAFAPSTPRASSIGMLPISAENSK